MKRVKRVLSFTAIGSLLASLLAASVPALAADGSAPYTPPFYGENYTVVRAFTDEEELPWDRDGYGKSIVTESDTPSPDGSAAQLTFNQFGRGQYIFSGLDFAGAEAGEAFAFWYDADFDGKIALGIEVATEDSDLAEYTLVDFSYVTCQDGAVSQGASGTVGVWDNSIGGWKEYEQHAMLGGMGFVIVSAENLKAAGIDSLQAVKRIRFGAPGDGQADVQTGNHPLYVDDLGYVNNVETFQTAVQANHDVSALTAAIEAAEELDEAAYTEESWASLESAVTAAKTAVEEFKDVPVLVDTKNGTLQIAEAAAQLTAAQEGLDEKPEPEPEPEPEPGPEPDVDKPVYYNDNFTVVQDFTDPDYLPWDRDSYGTAAVTDSDTPSPDNTAMQLTFNTFGRGQYIFPGLDFAGAEAGDALVFWYDADFDATIALGVEVATEDSDLAEYTRVDFSYVTYQDGAVSQGTSGTVGVWDNSIGGWKDYEQHAMLGGMGFVIVSAENLKAAGIDSLQAVKRIRFGAPGDGQTDPSPASQNSEDLRFILDDIGYVQDVDAFIRDVKAEHEITYLVNPIEPDDAIQLEVVFEGTFADASWTEFADAYQYFVNVYTVDGEAYTYVRTNNTRQTSATLSELLPSTAYAMQVLAMNEDEKVLSASNVVNFTTLEEDRPPYLDGPLPHEESMTIDQVIVSNGTDATVEWEWIDGVYTYTVYLYTVKDGAYTFVEKQDARFGEGSVSFTGLDKSQLYVAQVVAYDISESIIFAYKPAEFDLSGNSDLGDSDTSEEPGGSGEIPDTGVGFPAAAAALALCAFAAAAVSKKLKAE